MDKKGLFVILIMIIFLFSCQKETVTVDVTAPEVNMPPEIQSISVDSNSIVGGDQIQVTCIAVDPDDDYCIYIWEITGGPEGTDRNMTTMTSSVTWYVPDVSQTTQFMIKVTVQENDPDIDPLKSDTDYILVTVSPRPPDIHELTLYPVDDAFINKNSPDTNYGSLPYLYTGNTSEEITRCAYFKFDIADIPSNAVITKAELWLVVGNSNTGTYHGESYLYYVGNNTWQEESITYNNRPYHDPDTIIILLNILFGDPRVISFDIKHDLEDNISSTSWTYYSLALESFYENTGYSEVCYYYASEAGEGLSPRLHIEYYIE